MFADKLYDGFSIVSTGVKCTLAWSAYGCAVPVGVQFRQVFSPAVFQHVPYMKSAHELTTKFVLLNVKFPFTCGRSDLHLNIAKF